MIVQTLLLAAATVPVIQQSQTPPPNPPVPSEQQESPSFSPTALEDTQTWFSNDRLPQDFGALREQSTVGWRALVSFDGRVLNCFAAQSSGDLLLDSQTCDIVRRVGRFAAARDDQGKSVMAYYQGSTRWTGLRLRPPDPVAKPTAVAPVPILHPPPPAPTAVIPRPYPAKAELRSRNWLSGDDYPSSSLRNLEEGPIALRLHVGRDGRVFACGIDQSASLTLDTETCRVAMRRMRFHPALDARGQAVADKYTTRIIWRIPKSPAWPVRFVTKGGEEAQLRLVYGKRGAITSCAATSGNSDVAALSTQLCAVYARQDKPQSTRRGPHPAAGVTVTVTVNVAME